jgi:hypothetical protein
MDLLDFIQIGIWFTWFHQIGIWFTWFHQIGIWFTRFQSTDLLDSIQIRIYKFSFASANATKSVIAQPNPQSQTILGTTIRFTCSLRNWYFNYSVPKDLVSFYYSTNYNSSVLTCNGYGCVTQRFYFGPRCCCMYITYLYGKKCQIGI